MKTKQLFDNWAKSGEDERAAKGHSYAAFQVLDAMSWKPGDAYLDIGCGNGYTVRHVAPHITNGSAIGVDLSGGMIVNARTMTNLDIPTTFIQTDFMEWKPEEDLRFDKIFSMETFYYFPDVAAAIRKTAGLLKPGGVFACIVDFYAENAASADWPEAHECGVPMQRHSMTEWTKFFRAAGLTDIRQWQIRYPAELATSAWKTDVGSLVTTGSKLINK